MLEVRGDEVNFESDGNGVHGDPHERRDNIGVVGTLPTSPLLLMCRGIMGTPP